MNLLISQNHQSGFFSNFNVIVGALNEVDKSNVENFTIIWNNPLYQTNDENLFVKYFAKTKLYSNYDIIHTALELGGCYYQPINGRDIFINSNRLLKKYEYFNNEIYLDIKSKCVQKSNTLGVHIRLTDHVQHGALISVDAYCDLIDQILTTSKYDYIFLATDEWQALEKLISRYGKMVIYNDVIRSDNGIAFHTSNQHSDREKLAIDVLYDGISLSLCDEMIITSSNVSGYSLSLNPTVKYTFIDQL